MCPTDSTSLPRIIDIPVPLSTSTIRVAVVQLDGPTEDAKLPVQQEDGVVELVWIETPELEGRAAKVIHILKWLQSKEPHLDLVVFPEYSYPCRRVLPSIIEWSRQQKTIVVAGADSGRSPDGPVYNTSTVVLPDGSTIDVLKRQPSEYETAYIATPSNPGIYRFVWQVGESQYWFMVYICLDFPRFALRDSLLNSITGPGLFVVPMCSRVIDDFYPYASVLLRTEGGTATLLANTVGPGFAGSSSVTCAFPGPRLTNAPLILPDAREAVAVFDLDLSHLTLPRPTALNSASPLRRMEVHYIADSDSGTASLAVAPAEATATVRGVINPAVLQLSGKVMRIAFLQVQQYASIIDRVRGQSFETLAVLGHSDLIITHVHQYLAELLYDLFTGAELRPRSIQPPPTPSGTGNGAPHHEVPHFQVTSFYKILGLACPAANTSIAHSPGPADLTTIAALGQDWYDPLISDEVRNECLKHHWILDKTQKMPGKINAIMTIALENRGVDLPKRLRDFESQVIPHLVANEHVTSVYGGTGFQMTADFVLRISAEPEHLFAFLGQLHEYTDAIREWVVTNTYIVLEQLSRLKIDDVFRQEVLPPADEAYADGFLMPHLAGEEKLRFSTQSMSKQLALLGVFRDVERAAQSVKKFESGGHHQQRRWDMKRIRATLGPALVHFYHGIQQDEREDALHDLKDVHDVLQAPVERLLDAWVGKLGTEAFATAKTEGKVASQKEKDELSYTEKIRVILAAPEAIINEEMKDSASALQRTVRLRNAFSHSTIKRVDELGMSALGEGLVEYCRFLARWG